MTYRFCLLVLLSVLASAAASAQKSATVSGTVKDEISKETLISATIMLESTKLGAKSNKSGYYSVQNVPAGEYSLRVTYLGYEKYIKKITLAAGQNLRLDILLKPVTIQTETVEVEANRELVQREITISTVNVPVHQIQNIRVGGESDVFRTLQFLPGVLTSSQLSSGLFVRGGSPDQNLILLDGASVYNPSHLFGFFSTFNTNAIKDIEFVKGGFDAEYGGRLSSVLNVTQKDGNRSEFHGDISLGLISSQANIEGPLFNGSFFLSGRRTYIDLIQPIIPQSPEEPLPNFYFYDINAKVVQEIGDNDKVAVTGFYSNDILDFSGSSSTIGMRTGNRLLSGHWSHIFADNLFSNVVVNYSEYSIKFSGGESGYGFLLNNGISDLTGKANLEWFIKENASAKFGFEVNKLNFSYLMNFTGDTDTTANTGGIASTNMEVPDLNYALFAQTKFNITEYLAVQAGLRGSYFQLNESMYVDPRIALRYMLTGNISLKAAWGIYHQGLRLATLPDFNIIDTWLPSDTTVPISRSNHYIFSIETHPFDGYDFNVEGYYKTMDGISELNSFSMNTSSIAEVVYVGDAHSYGAEIFLQKKSGRLTGWIGYALGFIYAQFDSINAGREFRPKYDRRHDIKVVAQYRITDDIEVGGTFTLQSGQSYTGNTSRGRILIPDMIYGRNKQTASERYGLRLPMSHQLNLYGSYDFKMFKKFDATLVVDIYNVYNRRDILMRYYNTIDDVTVVEDVLLLPIFPSISLEISF